LNLSAGIYFDNDFAAFVGTHAGEHFVRSNRIAFLLRSREQ
jgi:hypothetical protein